MDLAIIKKRYIDFIIEQPKKCFQIILVIFLFAAWGVSRLESEFQYKIWFQKDDPELLKFNQFERMFGNDEVIIISLYHNKSMLQKKNIEIIRKLTDEVWKVKGVIDVDSLTSHHHIYSNDDEILIRPLFKDQSLYSNHLRVAKSHPAIQNYLLNQNSKLALIYAKQKPYIDSKPDESAIAKEAQDIVDKFKNKYPEIDFKLSGGIILGDTFKVIAKQDITNLVPIMFALLAIILLIYFRKLYGLLVPYAVTFMAVLSTFSLAGFTGITFNNILALIPQVLMAISIADSIHILVNYDQYRKNGDEKKLALRKSFEKNFYPALFTTISTAIGFLSFMTAFMKPLIDFGILCSFGTVLAFPLTYLCCSIIILTLPEKRIFIKEENKKDNGNTLIENYVKWIEVFRYHIVIVSVFLMIVGIYLIGHLKLNTNQVKSFQKDVPIRVANDFILEKLGGVPGPELVIDSGLSSGIYDPNFLKKTEKFINWLENQKGITKINSIIDVLKQMNKVIHNNQNDYYSLSDDRRSNAEYTLLYQMGLSNGKNINDRISLDERYLRLSILWSLQESKESLQLLDKITKRAKKAGLQLDITGKSALFLRLDKKVSFSLIYSVSLALVLIFILLIIVLKSMRLSFISLFANTFPLIIGSAVMALLKIDLSFATVLVFSVCLGIVVDDTIHFILYFKRKHKNNSDILKVLEDVLFHSGSPILLTTLILVLGFSLFLQAKFLLNVNFGIISSSIIGSALIIDLLILPALLIIMDDFQKRDIQ